MWCWCWCTSPIHISDDKGDFSAWKGILSGINTSPKMNEEIDQIMIFIFCGFYISLLTFATACEYVNHHLHFYFSLEWNFGGIWIKPHVVCYTHYTPHNIHSHSLLSTKQSLGKKSDEFTFSNILCVFINEWRFLKRQKHTRWVKSHIVIVICEQNSVDKMDSIKSDDNDNNNEMCTPLWIAVCMYVTSHCLSSFSASAPRCLRWWCVTYCIYTYSGFYVYCTSVFFAFSTLFLPFCSKQKLLTQHTHISSYFSTKVFIWSWRENQNAVFYRFSFALSFVLYFFFVRGVYYILIPHDVFATFSRKKAEIVLDKLSDASIEFNLMKFHPLMTFSSEKKYISFRASD